MRPASDGERWNRLFHVFAASDLGVPGHGADDEIVPFAGDAGEFANVLEIDERSRRRETLLHGRQQGHARRQAPWRRVLARSAAAPESDWGR